MDLDRVALGYISESPRPQVSRVNSSTPLPVGEYVCADFRVKNRSSGDTESYTAVAVVSNSGYRMSIQPGTASYSDESRMAKLGSIDLPKYSPIDIYIVANLKRNKDGSYTVETPRYPIPPNTPIYPAPKEILELVYSIDSTKGIKLGHLAERRDVEVYVDVDKLSKHLLIAGATGSGKSNTVAIIADRLASLGAPVVIFDVHGEYGNLESMNRDRVRVEHIEAAINPLDIEPRILASMIIREAAATRQRRMLRMALSNVVNRVFEEARRERKDLKKAISDLFKEEGKKQKTKPLTDLSKQGGSGSEDEGESKLSAEEMFRDLILRELDQDYIKNLFESKKIESVKDKVEEFFEYAPVSLDAKRIRSFIEPGKIVVVDVSEMSDDQKAWILKLLSDDLLNDLKARKGEGTPTVLVVEEAPVFISIHENTPAKESLQKFAREGRKFGAILVIVSQRPRDLDINVVSQLQNFIFLKMVQSEDVQTIMNIADSLEESLAETIPSLPTGRAIVLGEWVGRFPVLVDIDMHKGKKMGTSPAILELWRAALDRRMRSTEDVEELDVP